MKRSVYKRKYRIDIALFFCYNNVQVTYTYFCMYTHICVQEYCWEIWWIDRYHGTPPILLSLPILYVMYVSTCMCGWKFAYSLCVGYCICNLASHSQVSIYVLE